MSSSRDRRSLQLTPSLRRQRSKWQREQSKQKAIIIAGIIAIVLILAIPAYGYWTNFIAPPRAVILQVDDRSYTLGFMTKYMLGLQDFGANAELTSQPFQIIQLLEENELVRIGSYSRGLTIAEEDLDTEIRDRIIGISPELENVREDQLDREFKETYENYLNTVNLSEKEHREMAEASLLRVKLKDSLGQEVPQVAKQAYVHWIVLSTAPEVIEGTEELVDTEAKVETVKQRIEDGDDFAVLAEEYSTDRGTAVNGGDVGWIPEGAYPPLDPVIFSLDAGSVSDPVDIGATTYFIKVTDVDDARAVDPDMRDRLKELVLQTWIVSERGNHRIQVCFGGGDSGGSCDWQYDWMIKQLIEARSRST